MHDKCGLVHQIEGLEVFLWVYKDIGAHICAYSRRAPRVSCIRCHACGLVHQIEEGLEVFLWVYKDLGAHLCSML